MVSSTEIILPSISIGIISDANFPASRAWEGNSQGTPNGYEENDIIHLFSTRVREVRIAVLFLS
jgi:hypothetical protein